MNEKETAEMLRSEADRFESLQIRARSRWDMQREERWRRLAEAARLLAGYYEEVTGDE